MAGRLRRALVAGAALLMLTNALSATQVLTTSQPAQAATNALGNASFNMDPNAAGTATGWSFSNTTGCTSTVYTCINDHPDSTGASYILSPNATNTNNASTFNLVDTPTDYGAMVSLQMTVWAKNNSAGVVGTADTVTLTPAIQNGSTNLVSGNTAVTPGASWTAYTWNLSTYGSALASTWNAAVVKMTANWTAVSGTDTTAQIQIASVRIAATYSTSQAVIAQQGYIFENDDATNSPDGDSAQTAGNTAITGVQPGERLNLRTQIKATTNAQQSNAGLFYDRNDGYWSKVQTNTPAVTSSGSCTDTNFSCTSVDTTSTVDGTIASTTDSVGNPWVSYQVDTPVGELRVANYVGTGGNCNSSAWNCVTLTNQTGAGSGFYSSIAADKSGNIFVSYFDSQAGVLKLAQNTPGTGCAVTTWTCTTIASSVTMASIDNTAIAIGPSGVPWIAYPNGGAAYLAQYVGSGGNCTSTAWNGCAATIDSGSGTMMTLAFSPLGVPWMAWKSSSNNIEIAGYIAGSGCANASYTCWSTEATSGHVDANPSIAFDPNGVAYVSYYDDVIHGVRVAYYVGGSAGTGCANSAAWTCTTVDSSSAAMGKYSQIAFDPAGVAWVAYYDATNLRLRLARHLGAGGNCTDTTWTCTTIDTGNDVGMSASMNFGPDGTAWIAYQQTTGNDLRVANLNRGGEFTPSASYSLGTNAGSTSHSHSDMTSVTDTTNQADADCISGTWVNGKLIAADEGTISLGAAKCSEYIWPLDTSRAQLSKTYRFAVSFADAAAGNRAMWRGPSTISAYPTLSTVSSLPTTTFSKDGIADSATACYDTTYACTAVDTTGSVGLSNAIAVDGQGKPWMVYDDTTNSTEKYSIYVGSGNGSGCASTAYTCGVLDSSTWDGGSTYASQNAVGLAFAPDGTAWATWYDSANGDLRVAKYVGTGGSNCGTGTAWTCYTVDSTGDVGQNPSLAIDKTGLPWISYHDNTNFNIKVARLTIGNSGTGCALANWTCSNLAADSTVAFVTGGGNGFSIGSSSISVDSYGRVMVAYNHYQNRTVSLATYVGSAGSGCITGNAQWSCVVTHTISTAGHPPRYLHLLTGRSGDTWIGWNDAAQKTLVVEHYLNGATTGSCSNTGWDCTVVGSDTNTPGRYLSMALDAEGMPWMVWKMDANNTRYVSRYVGGTSGTGCASTAWTCTALTDPAASTYSAYSGIVFDRSGIPWISQYQNSAADLYVSKLKVPNVSPAAAGSTYGLNNGNGQSGDLRYHLDAGLNPRPSTCSSSLSGYCGLAANDSNLDAMLTQPYETAMYQGKLSQASNASLPNVKWVGQSTVALSTDAIYFDVWNRTTKQWVNISSNSTTAATTTATLAGVPGSGVASDYWAADGSNYAVYVRAYQVAGSTAQAMRTNFLGFNSNTAPSTPTSLTQKDSGGTAIGTGNWTNSTTVTLGGTVSDPDTSDTDQLCVEVQPINTAFSGVDTACGSLVAQGSVTSVSFSPVDGTQYHWQARTKDASAATSSYTSFGGNSDGSPPTTPADPDFKNDRTAPSAPTSLAQYKADGTTSLGLGAWNPTTTTYFKATVADTTSMVTICVEAEPIGTAFNNTTFGCGLSFASGATADTYTVGTSDVQYHWQASARDDAGNYSSWVAFGGNSDTVTADPDFGIDNTAPTTGTIYDGASAGVDASYNNGSLSSLSCNWSGFSDAGSGIANYQYSFGVSAGDITTLGWTTVSSATTLVSPTGLTLRTGQRYFCNVKAIDTAGNTTTYVASDGQFVAPTLTFNTSTNAVNFSLNPGNSYTSTQSMTVSTSTNAYNGYTVKAYESQPMTYGSNTIADYAAAATAPTTWSGTGFGYNITGGAAAAMFSGSKYAHFGTQATPDTPVSHAGTITGTPISAETETINFKVVTPSTQTAGSYKTNLILTATASY